MAKKEAAKNGRPSDYTDAIADKICSRMWLGESLKKITDEEEMPSRPTIYRWLKTPENESFRNNYALAREGLADFYFDQCIEISDDGKNDTYIDKDGKTRTDHDVVHRSRLRIDTRKWVCGRMLPKKYGEKVEEEGAKTSAELPQSVIEGQPKLDEPLK